MLCSPAFNRLASWVPGAPGFTGDEAVPNLCAVAAGWGVTYCEHETFAALCAKTCAIPFEVETAHFLLVFSSTARKDVEEQSCRQ